MIAKKPAPTCSGAVSGFRQNPGSDWIRRARSRLRDHTCASAVIQIKMEKLEIIPAQVTAHVGDTVEWVNADFVAHTATARDGALDVLIPVNAARSVVLKAAGQLDYHCKFHPNMTGQISVSK
jgi:plastocyanin